jgi:hypothetical protein
MSSRGPHWNPYPIPDMPCRAAPCQVPGAYSQLFFASAGPAIAPMKFEPPISSACGRRSKHDDPEILEGSGTCLVQGSRGPTSGASPHAVPVAGLSSMCGTTDMVHVTWMHTEYTKVLQRTMNTESQRWFNIRHRRSLSSTITQIFGCVPICPTMLSRYISQISPISKRNPTIWQTLRSGRHAFPKQPFQRYFERLWLKRTNRRGKSRVS